MISALAIDSPLGRLLLVSDQDALIRVEWGTQENAGSADPLLKRAADQMQQYFAGKRRGFDLPLKPAGTQFRLSVWRAMQGIAYGHVATYGDLAKDLQSSPRAIGGACGANPIPIIIPCHRVIGHNQRLTGFSAPGGLATKTWLLQLEESNA